MRARLPRRPRGRGAERPTSNRRSKPRVSSPRRSPPPAVRIRVRSERSEWSGPMVGHRVDTVLRASNRSIQVAASGRGRSGSQRHDAHALRSRRRAHPNRGARAESRDCHETTSSTSPRPAHHRSWRAPRFHPDLRRAGSADASTRRHRPPPATRAPQPTQQQRPGALREQQLGRFRAVVRTSTAATARARAQR